MIATDASRALLLVALSVVLLVDGAHVSFLFVVAFALGAC
jgi:hypothetical protein